MTIQLLDPVGATFKVYSTLSPIAPFGRRRLEDGQYEIALLERPPRSDGAGWLELRSPGYLRQLVVFRSCSGGTGATVLCSERRTTFGPLSGSWHASHAAVMNEDVVTHFGLLVHISHRLVGWQGSQAATMIAIDRGDLCLRGGVGSSGFTRT